MVGESNDTKHFGKFEEKQNKSASTWRMTSEKSRLGKSLVRRCSKKLYLTKEAHCPVDVVLWQPHHQPKLHSSSEHRGFN